MPPSTTSLRQLASFCLHTAAILALILAGFAFPPVQAARAGTTWTVCASGCNFTKIMDAILSASVLDGDILFLDEDVHTETYITLGKSITLYGRGRDLTILQAAAAPDYANQYLLDTYGSGKKVTIRDMTLRNGGSTTWTWRPGAPIGILTATTLQNLLITQNYDEMLGTTAKGGGIYASAALTITDCIISGNQVRSDNLATGGGLYGDTSSEVKIFNSTISNNQAIGKAVTSGSGTTPQAMGGGIYAMNKITIQNSTISGNTATGGNVTTGTAGRAFGGGISSSIVWDSVFTITNSTISGNTAAGGTGPTGGAAYGGGTSINSGTLDFTTVVSNTASGNLPQGGGIYYYSPWDRTVNLKNSIFSDNHGPSDINGPDLFGTFTSQDYNLIKTTSGYTINGTTTHNITGVSPNLLPLANNGGFTLTHAPRLSSPVINTIPSGTNGCTPGATTDQTGKQRPSNGACEMGAYEMPWRLYLPVVLR
jgi:hypothetical protein